MNVAELREKSVDELKQELIDSNKELFNLKIQRSAGQPPKPGQFKKVKLSIARLKTLLTEKGQRV